MVYTIRETLITTVKAEKQYLLYRCLYMCLPYVLNTKLACRVDLGSKPFKKSKKWNCHDFTCTVLHRWWKLNRIEI